MDRDFSELSAPKPSKKHALSRKVKIGWLVASLVAVFAFVILFFLYFSGGFSRKSAGQKANLRTRVVVSDASEHKQTGTEEPQGKNEKQALFTPTPVDNELLPRDDKEVAEAAQDNDIPMVESHMGEEEKRKKVNKSLRENQHTPITSVTKKALETLPPPAIKIEPKLSKDAEPKKNVISEQEGQENDKPLSGVELKKKQNKHGLQATSEQKLTIAECERMLTKTSLSTKEVDLLLKEINSGKLKRTPDDLKKKCSISPLIKPLLDIVDYKGPPDIAATTKLIADVQTELQNITDPIVKSFFNDFDQPDPHTTLITHLKVGLENIKDKKVLRARYNILKDIIFKGMKEALSYCDYATFKRMHEEFVDIVLRYKTGIFGEDTDTKTKVAMAKSGISTITRQNLDMNSQLASVVQDKGASLPNKMKRLDQLKKIGKLIGISLGKGNTIRKHKLIMDFVEPLKDSHNLPSFIESEISALYPNDSEVPFFTIQTTKEDILKFFNVQKLNMILEEKSKDVTPVDRVALANAVLGTNQFANVQEIRDFINHISYTELELLTASLEDQIKASPLVEQVVLKSVRSIILLQRSLINPYFVDKDVVSLRLRDRSESIQSTMEKRLNNFEENVSSDNTAEFEIFLNIANAVGFTVDIEKINQIRGKK